MRLILLFTCTMFLNLKNEKAIMSIASFLQVLVFNTFKAAWGFWHPIPLQELAGQIHELSPAVSALCLAQRENSDVTWFSVKAADVKLW